jgi:hypothetical protein
VALGKANSRMKDFYDKWVLSKTFDFNHARLARAIAATFARRQTAIPEAPPDACAGILSRRRQVAAMVSLCSQSL